MSNFCDFFFFFHTDSMRILCMATGCTSSAVPANEAGWWTASRAGSVTHGVCAAWMSEQTGITMGSGL